MCIFFFTCFVFYISFLFHILIRICTYCIILKENIFPHLPISYWHSDVSSEKTQIKTSRQMYFLYSLFHISAKYAWKRYKMWKKKLYEMWILFACFDMSSMLLRYQIFIVQYHNLMKIYDSLCIWENIQSL